MLIRLISVLLLFVNCSKRSPEISFEKEIINIGEIKHDTIIEVLFKPTNIGKSILKIEKVKSDCHCTVPKNFQKKIEPNEVGNIKIIYHSKNFGYFEQLIEVYSNTKESPTLLILQGKVLME